MLKLSWLMLTVKEAPSSLVTYLPLPARAVIVEPDLPTPENLKPGPRSCLISRHECSDGQSRPQWRQSCLKQKWPLAPKKEEEAEEEENVYIKEEENTLNKTTTTITTTTKMMMMMMMITLKRH